MNKENRIRELEAELSALRDVLRGITRDYCRPPVDRDGKDWALIADEALKEKT